MDAGTPARPMDELVARLEVLFRSECGLGRQNPLYLQRFQIVAAPTATAVHNKPRVMPKVLLHPLATQLIPAPIRELMK
jgi:hypothetical protein